MFFFFWSCRCVGGGKEIRKNTKNKQITLIEIILKQQKQPAAGEFFNGFGALKRQIPLKKSSQIVSKS